MVGSLGSAIIAWQDIGQMLHDVFGGDTPEHPLGYGQIVARALLVYIAGLLVVRIGKSRLIGRSTSLDVILGFILGSTLSRGITGSASLSGTIVASLALVGVHYCLTGLACRQHWLGWLIKGNAKLLIENGEIRWDEMRSSHISKNDLLEELRLNANIDDVSKVRAAYKERSGEIGVVRADL